MNNNLLERINKLKSVLEQNIIQKEIEINNISYIESEYKENNNLPEINTMKSFDGSWNGKNDSHLWFYFQVNIQEYKNTRCEIKLTTNQSGWDASNPQFLVYVDGLIIQGLDTNHLSFKIEKGFHDIFIYAYKGYELSKNYCEDANTNYVDYSNTPLKINFFITYINLFCEELYYDILSPIDVLKFTRDNSKEYVDIINIINETLKIVDFLNLGEQSFYDSCLKAIIYIKEVFYNNYCKKGRTNVYCVGHTHIDIGWLWPVRQTREKAQRSFATQLELMREYKEYKFMSSQAYLYDAIKKDVPSLYEEIKKRVKEGRWEVEGAMWVEADCNLISGESLIRQIVTGKNFFKDEFNIDSRILWLPDVFGYSQAIPQILKKAGVDTFVTSKISWNDTNTMPYDIFNWIGLDGSSIFTYFLTAQDMEKSGQITNGTTYVGFGNAQMISGTYNRLQQKELTDKAILTYGYGDGGGGATRGFIENIKRMEYGIPNVPTTKFTTVTKFINDLKLDINQNKLPIWNGELYLEFHRGTYTSIAKNKLNNRRSEFLITNIEKVATMNYIYNHQKYPRTFLHSGWKMILTNQFHDILPGSAITEVYKVTDQEYEHFFNEGITILNNNLEMLAGQKVKNEECFKIAVFNPNNFNTSGFITINDKELFVDNVDAFSVKPMDIINLKVKNVLTNHPLCIESNYYQISFNNEYEIISIYDKENKREILKSKACLVAYEDYPSVYSAWEIRNYYQEKKYEMTFLSVKDYETDVRIGKKIKYKLHNSLIEVTISLNKYQAQIDFTTELNWQDDHIILKHHFPIDVNTTIATCDTQFGSIKRQTTVNTTWDQAKFEFCAHKYVDISEGNYGVSLINNSKYGYSCINNDLALTLLKCSNSPSDSLDKGTHIIKYSLIPHSGDVNKALIEERAMLFNNPLIVINNKVEDRRVCEPFIEINEENISVSTIKLAEKSDDVIIRINEYMNKRSEIVIKFNFDFKEIYLCDLMEKNIQKLDINKNSIIVNILPFEIKTFKIII